MDSQMQRDREAKADEAINAINRKAGRNMPQAVGTAIALIAIILHAYGQVPYCSWCWWCCS